MLYSSFDRYDLGATNRDGWIGLRSALITSYLRLADIHGLDVAYLTSASV